MSMCERDRDISVREIEDMSLREIETYISVREIET